MEMERERRIFPSERVFFIFIFLLWAITPYRYVPGCKVRYLWSDQLTRESLSLGLSLSGRWTVSTDSFLFFPFLTVFIQTHTQVKKNMEKKGESEKESFSINLCCPDDVEIDPVHIFFEPAWGTPATVFLSCFAVGTSVCFCYCK